MVRQPCDRGRLFWVTRRQQMAGLLPQKMPTLCTQLPPPSAVLLLLLLQLCYEHFRLCMAPSRRADILCCSEPSRQMMQPLICLETTNTPYTTATFQGAGVISVTVSLWTRSAVDVRAGNTCTVTVTCMPDVVSCTPRQGVLRAITCHGDSRGHAS